MFTEHFINHFTDFSLKLSSQQFWKCENVFNEESLSRLTQAFEDRRGELRLGKIGKGILKTKKVEIRNDYIRWISLEEKAFGPAWALLDQIQKAAREELFLPIKRYEAQMALYPQGHFYKKHVDRHQLLPSRLLTFVFYFNDWQKGDGGELILYKENDELTIAPIKNSAIVFLSKLEHQVLPAKKERRSFTAWLRDDIG